MTGYLVLIVAALFVPVVAVAGYLAIALYLIIPFRTARSSGSGTGGAGPKEWSENVAP